MAQNSCAAARSLFIGTCVLCFVGAPARIADGSAHLWQIKEVFTNADGSVQFIEMFSNGSNETFTDGSHLTINDGEDHSIELDSLSQNTLNRHLLFATPGFQAVAGIAPDFTFPTAPFFNPNAEEFFVYYDYSGDSITFAGNLLPKDGYHSLNDTNLYGFPPNLVSAVNSPMNLSNGSGLVPPPPTGDYNGNGVVDAADYVLWRKTLNQPVDPHGSGADGDGDGTVNIGDYEFWRERFGIVAAGAGANVGGAIPEPATGAMALGACLAIHIVCRRRRLGSPKSSR